MISIEIVEHTWSGGANLSSLRLRRKNIFYENQTYNHVGKTKMNLSDVDGLYHSFMVNLGTAAIIALCASNQCLDNPL